MRVILTRHNVRMGGGGGGEGEHSYCQRVLYTHMFHDISFLSLNRPFLRLQKLFTFGFENVGVGNTSIPIEFDRNRVEVMDLQ